MTKITEEMNKNAETSKIDYLKKFAKDMLRNTIFTGTYQEKRFVESLNSYRDVVCIDEGERDFIVNLMAVKNRIEDTLIKRPWIGITEPDNIGTPADYCLWVILPEETLALGKYWYRVKTVDVSINEVKLKLEVNRPCRKDSPRIKGVSEMAGSINISMDDICDQLKNYFFHFYKILTFENIKESVIFIALLVSTIIAAFINTIKYLLEYLLKFMRETSGLIKALTPIMINFFNLIAKIIFGLYHLVATLFADKRKPAPVYNAYYNIDPQRLMLGDPRERYNQYYPKELPYYPQRRSGVTITPLDE